MSDDNDEGGEGLNKGRELPDEGDIPFPDVDLSEEDLRKAQEALQQARNERPGTSARQIFLLVVAVLALAVALKLIIGGGVQPAAPKSKDEATGVQETRAKPREVQPSKKLSAEETQREANVLVRRGECLQALRLAQTLPAGAAVQERASRCVERRAREEIEALIRARQTLAAELAIDGLEGVLPNSPVIFVLKDKLRVERTLYQTAPEGGAP
ncbi:MAG: hypothetical protein AUK47_11840 [Deltaproteobacteria bacterium CG2_30_63_29]|nr:MAG: hypothetical protein AUK47_11840 [Deltaproteobacteria bacterium CG2_30_63_29]PJB43435.1 MAG: hypothetical protein CO108_10025 [Deltaproteobacteria bacterium CG_4_9_14_3_um_filter_63_12]